MSFHVVAPPTAEAEFAEVGKELVQASVELGMHLDPQGFLYAWASGLRVVIERDDESKKIVALAFVTLGKRWTDQDTTGTVLLMATSREREPMLEFIKQICAALGASTLFVENPLAVQKLKHREHTIIAYELR